MSRSLGCTLLTTRSPIEMVPDVMFSRPASMRSKVDLPQPEGPTSTTNSPSSIGIVTPCSTSKLPNDLRTSRMWTDDIQFLPLLSGDIWDRRHHLVCCSGAAVITRPVPDGHCPQFARFWQLFAYLPLGSAVNSSCSALPLWYERENGTETNQARQDPPHGSRQTCRCQSDHGVALLPDARGAVARQARAGGKRGEGTRLYAQSCGAGAGLAAHRGRRRPGPFIDQQRVLRRAARHLRCARRQPL